MKTSSLILLVMILTCVCAVISIPFVLQHRIAKGTYTRINSDQSFEYDRQSFKNVRVVSLTNLSFCTIVPSDSLMVDFERNGAERSESRKRGDTLSIAQSNNSSSQRIRIFLPQNVKIEANDCTLIASGSLDHLDSLNTEIKLVNSHLKVRPIFKDKNVPQFWNQLTLIGLDSSDVEMSGLVVVRQFEMKNINNVKLGDRIAVEEMKVSFDDRKRVYSSSNDDGLVIKGY